MRANDEATIEHIKSVETDNDHLRSENEILVKENESLVKEVKRLTAYVSSLGY